jgi:hypothetical protein
LLNVSRVASAHITLCTPHILAVQEKRLESEVIALEKDTGFKLRVLAQNYPETPGESTAPI